MSEADTESISPESDNFTGESDSDTEPHTGDSIEEDAEETDNNENNYDELRKSAADFEKQYEAIKKEIMDIQRSRVNTDTDEDDDIDDHEDQTDEGKYSAPKILRDYIDKVVDEIENTFGHNERDHSKESRVSSILRNSMTRRKSQSISEEQKKIADEILRKMPQIRSQQFQYFDMFIIVPYFHSLG